MKFVESIKELRAICQQKPSTIYSKNKTYEFFLIRLYRVFSIYFTKLGIIFHLSGNQMTFISIVVTLLGGVLFSFPHPYYWLLGSLMFIFFCILDCSDGELARYNKELSPFGRYFDLFAHGIQSSALFMGVSFGLYAFFSEPLILLLGFIVVISSLLRATSTALRYSHIVDYIRMTGDDSLLSSTPIETKRDTKTVRVYQAKKFLLTFFSVPYQIIIVSILDIFTTPIVISFSSFVIPLNWRMAWLLFFVISTPILLILDVRNTLRLSGKVNKELLAANK